MNLRHALAALGLIAPSCSPAPAHRASAPQTPAASVPPADVAGSAGPGADELRSSSPGPASTTTEAPATTVTVTVPATTSTTRRATTTTFVLPENRDDDLSDDEWWAAQPGYVAGQCGGSLPPCWVMRRESGGDPRIWNGGCYDGPCRGGSTASGKWQFLRSTWAGYAGYLNAADAPEHVQDDKARALWAGGKGCNHWGAC